MHGIGKKNTTKVVSTMTQFCPHNVLDEMLDNVTSYLTQYYLFGRWQEDDNDQWC